MARRRSTTTTTTQPSGSLQQLIDAGSNGISTDPYAAATDPNAPGAYSIPAGRDLSSPIGVQPGYNPYYLVPGRAAAANEVPAYADVPWAFQGTVNYYRGDEYYQLPHGTDLADLQRNLYALGMLNVNGVQYGSTDTKTVAAFAHLLADANRDGVTWNEELSTKIAIAKAGGQGVQPRQRAPLVVRVSDPDALKQTFQKVAQTLYGGNLPDDVVNNLVSAYQGLESSYQTSAYEAGGTNPLTGQSDPFQSPVAAGTAPTVARQPDPTAFVTTQIRQQFPNQVAATEFGTTLNQALDFLRASPPGATAAKG